MSINVETILNRDTVWMCPVFGNFTLEMLSIRQDGKEFELVVYPLDDVSQPRLIGPKIKTRAEAFKAAIDYVMGQSWLPEAVVKNLINLMGVEQP